VPRGRRQGARRQTYVALLRGVNLAGRSKVSMSDLRTLFDALEAEDVTTYLQSGNVVFKSRGADRAELTRAIEQEIRGRLGLGIAVLMRTKAQLAKVVGGNPFAGSEPATLHVTFLADKPDRDRLRKLDPKRGEPDEFHVAGQEIYLRCPGGYGRSKLTNAYFEKQLGVAATTRNWKTVTKLAELAGG
jgi:uncharacterized protein (DUF1697 family)